MITMDIFIVPLISLFIISIILTIKYLDQNV